MPRQRATDPATETADRAAIIDVLRYAYDQLLRRRDHFTAYLVGMAIDNLQQAVAKEQASKRGTLPTKAEELRPQ